jgi:hypothetical protein
VEVIRSEGDYKCDHYKETQVSDQWNQLNHNGAIR